MRGVRVVAHLQGEQSVLVEDRVGLRLRLPLGVEGEIGLHGRAEVVGLGEGLVGVPARELVPFPGGVGGLGGLGAVLHRLRLHGRAAVGIEGDRVARLGGRGGAGQHDEDLGRHRAGGGAEGHHRVGPVVVVHAGEHARGGGPGEGPRGPGVHRAPVGGGLKGRGVGVGDVHAGVLGVPVHHGGQLLAGDRPVGPEMAPVGAGGVAGDDAGLDAPGHGRVVPGAPLHIGEGGVARGGAARHAPQHRGDLGAREGLVGAEVARGPAGGRVGEARHEAPVGGLVDPGCVPLPGGHVPEGRGLGGGGSERGQATREQQRGDQRQGPAANPSPKPTRAE